MDKLKEFLKLIGVSAKTIDLLIDNKDAALDVSPFITEFKDGQKTLFENDPDFIGKIQGAEKAKQLDIVTRKIKNTFGLDAGLIKDKGIEEIITIAKTETTKSLDKTTQDLQAEVVAANNKLKEYDEIIIPKVKSEVETEKKNFKITNDLTKKIGGQKLRVPLEAAYPSIKAYLDSLYEIDYNDKGEPVIYNKGTKITPQNADKTKLLTVDDIVTEQLKKFQFIEESNADKKIDPKTGKPFESTIVPDDTVDKKDNSKPLPAHLERAKEHQENLKKTLAKQ